MMIVIKILVILIAYFVHLYVVICLNGKRIITLFKFRYINYFVRNFLANPFYDLIKIILITIIIVFAFVSPYISINLYNLTKHYFLAYISFDCFLKIISQGLILDKNSYLRQTWNLFDFIVIIIAYLEIIIPSNLP